MTIYLPAPLISQSPLGWPLCPPPFAFPPTPPDPGRLLLVALSAPPLPTITLSWASPPPPLLEFVRLHFPQVPFSGAYQGTFFDCFLLFFPVPPVSSSFISFPLWAVLPLALSLFLLVSLVFLGLLLLSASLLGFCVAVALFVQSLVFKWHTGIDMQY